ncbi:hypothetical protein LS684_03195 [Cytobacillus spongiae]|nr:hypothetical protein [Cytobacillus spongiae]UII58018.1 hypothetical protein LS684_03195 [Cytobacillus spongiae]
MMKFCFMLAAFTIPVSILFNQEAVGIVFALSFMLLAAYFSKPRFNKNKS